MPDFKKTFTPTTRMWAKIATFGRTTILKRTKRGIDRNGKRFPRYKARYATQKAKGFKDVQVSYQTRSGNVVEFRTKKRPKHLKGISLNKQINPPNFKLRGWTLRDLSTLAKNKFGCVIGWRGEFAQIVAGNEERGKYKVGGITDKEHKEIIKIADKHFQDRWNRTVKVETFNVKL